MTPAAAPTRCWRVFSAAAVVALIAGVFSRQANAQIPAPVLDRNYRFGDGDPGAVNGGTVGITRDDAGLLNMNQLIDLTAATRAGGLPTYVTITGRSTLDNPPPTALGIRLNPNPTDRQYLKTAADEALNFPEKSPSSTESLTNPPGTLDYNFLTDRGFQLWVQPQATTEGHIVMDSNNHGVLINASGKFAMRYSNIDYAGVTSPVVNTWYHLMVVHPNGPGAGSVLYVNGIAEAAATGPYIGEDVPNDEISPDNFDHGPLVVGSNSAASPFQLATQKYYHGVVDDLEMFVIGLNNTRDWGEFQFDRDNKYAALKKPTTQGDLNNDQAVTMADVTIFASNWLKENRLTWTQSGATRSLTVGDLNSRAFGDFNYDGRVDLSDWGILNNVNPALGAAALALIQGVPEPSTMLLIAAAGFAVAAKGFPRRRK